MEITIRQAIETNQHKVILNGHEWNIYWAHTDPKVYLVRRIRVARGKHNAHSKQVTIVRNRDTVVKSI